MSPQPQVPRVTRGTYLCPDDNTALTPVHRWPIAPQGYVIGWCAEHKGWAVVPE